MKQNIPFLLGAALCLTTPLLADKPGQPQWIFGMGASYQSMPYKEMDNKIQPLPIIRYEGKQFYWHTLEAGYKLFQKERSMVSLAIRGRMDTFEEGDSPYLSGMDERERTVEAGMRALLELVPDGYMTMTLFGDIAGKHKGYESTIKYAHAFEFKPLKMQPYAGVELLSEELADYYYGVKNTESTASRSAYEVDSATNLYGGIKLHYQIDSHWGIMGDARYIRLDDTITDSPIIEDDNQYKTLLGVIYAY